jgi:hypothetical protein
MEAGAALLLLELDDVEAAGGAGLVDASDVTGV